jgi:hypothetical protein
VATEQTFTGSRAVPNLDLTAARTAPPSDENATAVKYGLLATVVAVVVIAVMALFG